MNKPLKANELVWLAVKEIGGVPALSHATGYPPQTLRNWRDKQVKAPLIGVQDCLNAAGFELVIKKLGGDV